MILHIVLSEHSAELKLEEEGKTIASKVFLVDNDLAGNILLHTDELFRGANIDPLSLNDVVCESHNAGFTTSRIGETVANAWRLAIHEEKRKE